MAVEFRCEKCGKLLNVEAEPAAKVKCPYCKAKVVVPAGLAALPRPQVPPGVAPQAAPPVQAQQEEQLVPEGEDALMGVMAKLMPWVISLFFHAGVLVILAFITIVVLKTEAPAQITIPDAQLSENPGGRINPGEVNPDLKQTSLQQVNQKSWSKRDSQIATASLGQTDSQVQVFGIAGGSAGGSSADFGLTTGGDGSGPRAKLFGSRGNAYHIVYVIDRSGSMLDTFDEVRKEMLRSIAKLSPAQTFHVIFFAEGTPKENPPRRLVYAKDEFKLEAQKYLEQIQPMGRTEPIPALERAFQVLKQLPNNKRGRLIFLLTDAEFSDNQKVLDWLKANNPPGPDRVCLNTFLHVHRSPTAMDVLRQMAEQNGGRFKFVEASE